MGELLALKQGDYDKGTGILNIRHSFRNDAGKLTIVAPKTRGQTSCGTSKRKASRRCESTREIMMSEACGIGVALP